jgi:hypothetical protein
MAIEDDTPAAPQRPPSYGEAAVMLADDMGDPDVHDIKVAFADVLDTLYNMRNDPNSSPQAKRMFDDAMEATTTAAVWASAALAWRN